jgi:hypothetical protein
MHATYRFIGHVFVTPGFIPYEIHKHILRDAEQHAGLHGRDKAVACERR